MADYNFAFPSTQGQAETQTLGGSVIGYFTVRFTELEPFFTFSIMELEPFFNFSIISDYNFAFLSTQGQAETQTLGGSVIGHFAVRSIFAELEPSFNFSVMADYNFAFPSTQGQAETQTLGGSAIGYFTVQGIFTQLEPFFTFSIMELEPFFNFSIISDYIFAFPSTQGQAETQTLGGQ